MSENSNGIQGMRDEILKEKPVEIRCSGGCGKFLHKTSRGSVDPRKLEIECEKCKKRLMSGDWQFILEKTLIIIYIYRCYDCNLVYEKIYHGSEKPCKGCKTTRTIFVATNANPPVIVDNRMAA